MNKLELTPSINADDVEALSTHFSRFPLSRFERDVKEMRVFFCYKADESGLPASRIIAVDDSSSQGMAKYCATRNYSLTHRRSVRTSAQFESF